MSNCFIECDPIVGEECVIGKNIKFGRNVIIYDNVKIGDNTTIGDFSIMYSNVEIGKASYVEAFCILGEKQASYYRDLNYKNPKTIIGKNSLIRSNTIIYSGSEIGENFQTGHRVTIREESKIGNNVRIGTLSDVQGKCSIGNFVNIHSNVHISNKSNIKDFVWIFPYSILTNDPTPPSNELVGVTIEKYAVIATGTVILPGINIGEGSLVGAQSLVNRDVVSETVVAGNPAKEICSVRNIRNKITGESVYPWRYNFDRGMPWENIGYYNWENNPKTEE